MSSTQPLRVASIADMALDLDAMDVPKYLRERKEADLRVVPGKKPTWFHIRRIDTNVFLTYVEEGVSENERHRRAFQMGVALIENAPPPVTGTQFAPKQTSTSFGYHSAYTDEDVAKLPVPYVKDIGALAYALSAFLLPGSEVSFAPQPFSLLVWKGRSYRAAVRRKAESQSPSADADSETPAVKVSSGDAATDATATESATATGTPSAPPSTAS